MMKIDVLNIDRLASRCGTFAVTSTKLICLGIRKVSGIHSCIGTSHSSLHVAWIYKILNVPADLSHIIVYYESIKIFDTITSSLSVS
jgi:hypothetical protein